MATLYDFDATLLNGETVDLNDYDGKIVLLVNVASKCGFTPQYEGLENLYNKYKDDGFAVLGFPCNQFGAQEPGNADEIAKFCSLTYEVSFPVFEKTDVNGTQAHPLYKWMKAQKPGIAGIRSIKWNFTKFLVGRDGNVTARFGPNETPEMIDRHIKKLL